MKKIISLVTMPVIFFVATGYNLNRDHLISGKTMGTTYHIKVVTGRLGAVSALKEKIEKRLRAINQSMSTYIADSEISRFNAFPHVGEPFHVSEELWEVVKIGKELYHLTDGAWDGTINPLVNLWGFGPAKKRKTSPKKQEIDNLLPDVGFDNIDVTENRSLIKRNAAISLDLNSIAKGYAVDAVARIIRMDGIEHFLVEIGGEVYASGDRKDGKPWRVGINTPRIEASLDQVYRIVELRDKALATSGNYRNYFIKDGNRYSHILDPRTGYPIGNRVASASVTADTCTLADGLATALMVMGPEKGIALVNRMDSVECLIVSTEKDGSLTDYASNGFIMGSHFPTGKLY